MEKAKKVRNTSFIGVLKFAFKIMNKREKCNFFLLSIAYVFNGLFNLLPTMITAMLVSLIAGEEVFFFAMIAVGLGLLGIGFVFGGDDL